MNHCLPMFRFGASPEPVYINILRRPLDRLISHYYFIRYGDDFSPQHTYKKMGDTMVRFIGLKLTVTAAPSNEVALKNLQKDGCWFF